ncbi:hypothetical protein Pyn_13948 [Prunus yedoensis var. nudiflora]|uniref:Uncharacterized protein n=1 Tax=Prunus yedoensis var. nudiflora TaxID=2094558 RepID=A0A314YKL5_PRUYE|nr:hypothetical protein Pyn_13948 [Prunus yedoensis var. nudiflora]
MLGAILPKGELKTAITEKVEDFVSKILLPLFFLILGMRTHIVVVFRSTSLLIVMSIVALAFLAKFVVTFVAAIINKMPVRDSLAFGLVMNTKGLLAIIILNYGRDLHRLTIPPNNPRCSSLRSIWWSSVAMLIVHDTCRNIRKTSKITAKNQKHSWPSDQIVAAFEKLETESEESSLFVEALTVASSYTCMHEDICNLADDKSADLIIIPFHKQSNIDGGMDNGNPSFRGINKNLLENASCSLTIFVDRGLTDSSNIKNEDGHGCCRCAMLFIGGPDDREALAYAWRMASNPNPKPNISLIVMRQFIQISLPTIVINMITIMMRTKRRIF